MTPNCTGPDGKDCTALALLWAPAEFPPPDVPLVLLSPIQPVSLVLDATQDSKKFKPISVQIAPPPLLLIHGFWSDANETWGEFEGYLRKWYPNRIIHNVNYGGRNWFAADSFSNPFIQGILRAEIIESLGAAVSSQIVARQVDIFGHSMGGLVARWLLDKTLNEGSLGGYLTNPVRRLVTVGTPHLGSQLATALWEYKDKVVQNTLPMNVFVKGCFLKGYPVCTLAELMTLQGRDVTGGAGRIVSAGNSIQ